VSRSAVKANEGPLTAAGGRGTGVGSRNSANWHAATGLFDYPRYPAKDSANNDKHRDKAHAGLHFASAVAASATVNQSMEWPG
jgi:hypothetical protein